MASDVAVSKVNPMDWKRWDEIGLVENVDYFENSVADSGFTWSGLSNMFALSFVLLYFWGSFLPGLAFVD